MLVCDFFTAICLVLMPFGLLMMFRRKQIGYVLDGWFRALGIAMLSDAVYIFVHALQYAGMETQPVLMLMNAVRAVVIGFCTGFLFHRAHQIHENPALWHAGIEKAILDMQEFIRRRGRDESEIRERRTQSDGIC